jgi:hypothetical protein
MRLGSHLRPRWAISRLRLHKAEQACLKREVFEATGCLSNIEHLLVAVGTDTQCGPSADAQEARKAYGPLVVSIALTVSSTTHSVRRSPVSAPCITIHLQRTRNDLALKLAKIVIARSALTQLNGRIGVGVSTMERQRNGIKIEFALPGPNK